MQKLGFKQLLQHKLSSQQIQFIKLLQVSTAELEKRIKEELEENPALEEGKVNKEENDAETKDDLSTENKEAIDSYSQDEDLYTNHYKTNRKLTYGEQKEFVAVASVSLQESLIKQLGFLGLNERQYTIGQQLIGSIGEDGYVRRELEAIANDLLFAQNLEVSVHEIEEVLKKIQHFDPPGIGARNLPECLLIQLHRMNNGKQAHIDIAKKILTRCPDELFKKQYAKIQKKLGYSQEKDIKRAINLIVKLDPKPGGGADLDMAKNQYIVPDFMLSIHNGHLQLSLNMRNAPELRTNPSYLKMLNTYSKDKKQKEVISFVKQKLDAAKWFIDAIQQRQQTLLKTMQAIINFQHEYFLEGDDAKLRPMILKDIAQVIDMDISTVSRVVSTKTIQAHFGMFPLKYFFSEGISSDTGEKVSARGVKKMILNLIDNEDKMHPLSDEKLERILREKGYHIARRTIAKYREQLHLSIARLRKKLF